ncbi:hypothetical protein SSX86_000182 [Deinandra increscens subsp. villosa]|uniref:Membrane-associated kinase regulator 1 n=1 Tax=Deinandra increscens subsp. villosa TaxID=3103831 RepID=A0AAP0E093_9ASTR
MKMWHHHHRYRNTPRSQTLPSSPTHSSDFEFKVSLSPRKSSATNLCPADDIFYKGHLLPLHLSSSSSSSSDSHSSFSTEGSDSSRPSSVTDDDLHLQTKLFPPAIAADNDSKKPPNKYFSLSRFSSVFWKETAKTSSATNPQPPPADNINAAGSSSVKRMSLTAKEMIRKYLKKAKPLYEKLAQQKTTTSDHHKLSPPHPHPHPPAPLAPKTTEGARKENSEVISHSFSGNLRYPRLKRSCVSSCPSSMGSSPTRNNVVRGSGGGIFSSNSSSMEELQSAIQGAIAHCKNSMTQNK